jgi:Peptidoglycan-binding protein, CsiV
MPGMSAISTRRILSGALSVTCLLGAALGLRAQEPPAANTTVYNIEMIVFRDNGAQGGAENWGNQGASARTIAGDETAVGSAQVGRFVGVLPSSSYQLGDLENRMRASGAYVPVAHFAWSQTASSWGTRAGFSLQKLGVDVEGLSGTVFLEHGQFLHLGMMLNYAMTAPPPGLNAPPGTTFTINESRRVRYYDRNYFDHPAYGVIALVTPAQGARAPGR